MARPKKQKELDRVGPGEPAKISDFDAPELNHPYTGLYYRVPIEVREQLLPYARVKNYLPGHEIFVEGDDTSSNVVAISSVLSGAFMVIHSYSGLGSEDVKHVVVSIEGAGGTEGDVELSVINVPTDVTLRGKKNAARSTIRCIKPGQVLVVAPATILYEIGCAQIFANLSRILAIKVLNRHARFDLPIKDRIKVLFQNLSTAYDLQPGPQKDNIETLQFQYDLSQSKLADLLCASKQSIQTASTELSVEGYKFENGVVILPKTAVLSPTFKVSLD